MLIILNNMVLVTFMIPIKMPVHLWHHLDFSDCWKNGTPETVQGKPGLHTKKDVKRLNKCGCESVFFALKAMKYEQTPFFQGLWAVPPSGFTQETWMEMSGYRGRFWLAMLLAK